MKIFLTTNFMAIVLLIAFFNACSSDSSTNPNSEFIAADADFSNWMGWTLITEKQGTDPFLGDAHSGNTPNTKRRIYIKQSNAVRGENGQYPKGTIVVKQILAGDGSVIMIVAMAKRGGNFNSEDNGWEWFILNSNGTIQNRGDRLSNNMCNICHSAVKSNKDYIYSK